MIRTDADFRHASNVLRRFWAFAESHPDLIQPDHITSAQEVGDRCLEYLFRANAGIVEIADPDDSNVVSFYPALAKRDGLGVVVHV